MKILSFAAVVFSFSILLVSCQKEVDFQFENGNSTGTTKSIIGEYFFINMKSKGVSIVDAVQSTMTLKTITDFEYTTFNNKGTIKITSDKFTFSDLGYEIDTVMHLKSYIDGTSATETNLPFSYLFSPTQDIISDYVLNRPDSITLESGPFMADPSSGPSPSQDMGARIAWTSDTLRLLFNVHVVTPINAAGLSSTLTSDMKTILILKKK